MDQFWKKLKERYLLEFPTATEHEITAFYMKVTTLLPSFSGNMGYMEHRNENAR